MSELLATIFMMSCLFTSGCVSVKGPEVPADFVAPVNEPIKFSGDLQTVVSCAIRTAPDEKAQVVRFIKKKATIYVFDETPGSRWFLTYVDTKNAYMGKKCFGK